MNMCNNQKDGEESIQFGGHGSSRGEESKLGRGTCMFSGIKPKNIV